MGGGGGSSSVQSYPEYMTDSHGEMLQYMETTFVNDQSFRGADGADNPAHLYFNPFSRLSRSDGSNDSVFSYYCFLDERINGFDVSNSLVSLNENEYRLRTLDQTLGQLEQTTLNNWSANLSLARSRFTFLDNKSTVLDTYLRSASYTSRDYINGRMQLLDVNLNMSIDDIIDNAVTKAAEYADATAVDTIMASIEQRAKTGLAEDMAVVHNEFYSAGVLDSSAHVFAISMLAIESRRGVEDKYRELVINTMNSLLPKYLDMYLDARTKSYADFHDVYKATALGKLDIDKEYANMQSQLINSTMNQLNGAYAVRVETELQKLDKYYTITKDRHAVNREHFLTELELDKGLYETIRSNYQLQSNILASISGAAVTKSESQGPSKLGNVLSGAAAGAVLGPAGAVIGGLVGLLS
jgi:hypothetical protein